jgi:hypothetical protein
MKPSDASRKSLRVVSALFILALVLALCDLGLMLVPERNARLEGSAAAVCSPTPTPLPTPTPVANYTTQEEVEAAIDAIPYRAEGLVSTAYEVDEQTEQAVEAALESLEAEGYEAGFIVLDLRTGRSLSWNLEEQFYTASAIKGFYVPALAASVEGAYEADAAVMENVIRYSDNSGYAYLRNKYQIAHAEEIAAWIEKAGVDGSLTQYMYTDCSTRDMARLWVQNYFWFQNDPIGQQAADWFTTPNQSAIRTLVPEEIVTRTKAGWIYYIDSDEVYQVTNDGGIIYDGEYPYVLAVMTTVPSDFTVLEELVEPLLAAHAAMVADLTGGES